MESDSRNEPPGWLEQFRRVLGGRRRVLNEKELQEIIEASEQQGIIDEDEGEMLHSIFTFGETIVREIMVPRTDMVCCPLTASLEELLSAIIDSGHSRLPIFEGNLDRIVGVIYAKDLLRYWGRPAEEIALSDVMRAPFFIPETKNIEDLLQEFRSRRVHLAIAVDEYGGTSGLITIEDLIEEIVGDIQDEYDLEEEWLVAEGDTVIVDGRLNIEELEEYFGLTIPKEQFDTVGGFLSDLFGRVPAPGEEMVEYGLVMTVLEADARKVGKIRIRRSSTLDETTP